MTKPAKHTRSCWLTTLSYRAGKMRGMTNRTATGTFDMHAWTPTEYDVQPGAQLTKVSAQKAFQGAAYVGVERISGSVHGRTGNFVVTHIADAAAGMTVAVVSGSGTDELAGLSGHLTIDRTDDGAHTYTFEYDL